MGAELVGCQAPPPTPATHLCLADMWGQETGFVGGGWAGVGEHFCSDLCFQTTAPPHLPRGRWESNPEEEGLAQGPTAGTGQPGPFPP